tara:strand:+ start:77 stop:487 length:411 start_codon:yes stop_codon:yes gene_type:complete
MKLTKSKLKRLIKEELKNVLLAEDRPDEADRLSRLPGSDAKKFYKATEKQYRAALKAAGFHGAPWKLEKRFPDGSFLTLTTKLLWPGKPEGEGSGPAWDEANPDPDSPRGDVHGTYRDVGGSGPGFTPMTPDPDAP